MKRYIKSSTSSSVLLYHGGQLPDSARYRKEVIFPDLGLHVGSFEQAASHDSNILEVECQLKNIVDTSDLGDWNTPQAVHTILQAAGSSIDLNELIMIYRQAARDWNGPDWIIKSKTFNQLLIENGVSVIRYQNVEDHVNDACYCIVDPSVIKNIKLVQYDPSTIKHTSADHYRNKILDKYPQWVKNNLLYYKQFNDPYYPQKKRLILVTAPLDDDPDESLAYFDGSVAEVRKQLQNYEKNFIKQEVPDKIVRQIHQPGFDADIYST